MSLVAYDSSEDSNDSDVGDNEEIVLSNSLSKVINGNDNIHSHSTDTLDTGEAPKETSTEPQESAATGFEGHISDDDDELWKGIDANRTSKNTLQLPAPKHAQSSDPIDSARNNTMQDVKQTSVLQGLPAPKAPDKEEAAITSARDDVLEDLVKPKAAELASREKPPEKKRKVIKIAAPSLAQYDSDEDSAPAPKQLKPSKGGSGLFALLPEPKHASIKEAGRTLLPYTLTKKPAVPPKSSAPVKPKVIHNAPLPVKVVPSPAQEDESDGEDETSGPSINFFSIAPESSAKITQGQSTMMPAAPVSTPSLAEVTPELPEVKVVDNISDATVANPQEIESEQELEGNNEPLLFNKSATTTHAYPGPRMVPMGYEAAEDMEYNMEMQQQDVDDESVIPMQELLRLQGRHNRGREEINLIDVKGEAGTSAIDLMKNLTQETDLSSLSRKNKDQPSTQEKRKHQITYLAHRAKEREFDLKNQWANNRATKKQTQSKYGF